MKETLIQLVTLNKYDREIFGLSKGVEEDKAKLEKNERKLEKAKANIEEQKSTLLKKRQETERIDAEVKEAEKRIHQMNYQLLSIKDERAYDTMKGQIAEQKDLISIKENAEIEALNKMEEMEKEIAELEAKLEEDSKKVEEFRGKVKDADDECANQVKELKEKRDEYAKLIPVPEMEAYLRLLKLPNRDVMAETLNRTCQKCFRSLTREEETQVRMMEKIIFCSYCGRILYDTQYLGQSDDA